MTDKYNGPTNWQYCLQFKAKLKYQVKWELSSEKTQDVNENTIFIISFNNTFNKVSGNKKNYKRTACSVLHPVLVCTPKICK